MTDGTGVYRAFLDALNRQDLDGAASHVDTARYREDCVGYTKGAVAWDEATASLRQIWVGLPDLRVDLTALAADGDAVIAHGRVRGTNTGKLYGAPATKKSYESSFFDYVRLDGGLIVDRVQQADVLGQMRQLYGRAFGLVGLGALLWRLP
jgi:predicted ester cyclase